MRRSPAAAASLVLAAWLVLAAPRGLLPRGFLGGASPSRGARLAGVAGVARGAFSSEEDEDDELYMDPDFELEDEDDIFGSSSTRFLDEPPEQILDDWEKDEIVNEILTTNFQDPELNGQNLMKFRDVFKLLETLGVDKSEFAVMFGEVDTDKISDIDRLAGLGWDGDDEDEQDLQAMDMPEAWKARVPDDPDGGRFQAPQVVPGPP